jgi:hypothetical protein
MWLISCGGLIGLIWSAASMPFPSVGAIVADVAFALLIVTGVVVSRLTASVDERSVTATFGWGWPKRVIDVADIMSARAVRNSWWHGWGIRKVSRGWMYNLAGYDAVELELRSGRVFRIGTDEPTALVAAIERVCPPLE